MGDPRKLRKKYSTPTHPWQKLRIDEERELMKEYGFKNKEELWRLSSKLRNFKSQIKKLIPKHDEASERQKQDLIRKLRGMKLAGENAIAENLLEITLKDMCERRLQTIVFRKGLAHSIGQARQFIVHEHITIGERKITSPSYLVSADDEVKTVFSGSSPLVSEERGEKKPVMAAKKAEEPAPKKGKAAEKVPEVAKETQEKAGEVAENE